jgi:hypothetical protein
MLIPLSLSLSLYQPQLTKTTAVEAEAAAISENK